MIKIITKTKQVFETKNDLTISSGDDSREVKFLGITIYKKENSIDNNFKETEERKTGFNNKK